MGGTERERKEEPEIILLDKVHAIAKTFWDSVISNSYWGQIVCDVRKVYFRCLRLLM